MARNQYGKTWWGEQFLNALNQIDYGNRLPRGRSYANNGYVLSIDINENKIQAKVRGSRPAPYKIRISVPAFTKEDMTCFVNAIAKRPTIISKMLNKQLDPQILEIANEYNLKVFPEKWTDFEMNCSCPDWAVPCKHLAAVIYKISAAIDNDPFLVFKLHNLDLLASFEAEGIHVSTQSAEILKVEDIFDTSKKPNTKNYDDNLAYKRLSFAGLKPVFIPLIKLLDDTPAFYQGSGDFKEKYFKLLNSTVNTIQRIQQGKKSWGVILGDRGNHKPINKYDQIGIKINQNLLAYANINDNQIPLAEFLQQLTQIPTIRTLDYQPSTAALVATFQLAINLIANGSVIPQVIRLEGKSFTVRWLPALLSAEVKQLTEELESNIPPDILSYGSEKNQNTVVSDRAIHLLSSFISEIIYLLNQKNHDDIFLDLFFRNYAYPFTKTGEDTLPGGMQAWVQKYFVTQGQYRPQLVVHEGKGEYFLLYINIWDKKSGSSQPVPLKDILTLKKHEKKRYEILQNIMLIEAFVPNIDQHINEQCSTPIYFDYSDFAPFLMEMIPAIQLLDVDILLPKSLQALLRPRPSVKISAKQNKSFIGLKDVFDFNWQVALGDSVLDEDEFKKLLKSSQGLIKYKSNFIYVDEAELQKLYKHFSDTKALNSFDMLRVAISGEYHGSPIVLTEEIKNLIESLTKEDNIELPIGLNATLRPYQYRGYNWMYRNAKIGFGSVLADDMGLGKTLQVITTILKYKEEGLLDKNKVLVVAPTGLLSNWEAEIRKFAPSLNSYIYHGAQRKIGKEIEYDILISSYGVVRSDAAKLKKLKWHVIVIDEAQNIKNNTTIQSRAVKSLPANNYIAMSGTPVENRLSEMWSIMDFTNKGYLGTIKDFNEQFAIPIEQRNDESVAAQLKKSTAPFMMRRLKSDKSIISDLPDKIEMDAYASLTKEQASLYEETLQKAMRDIEEVEDTDSKALFVKRGLVLQMILALKQICNHPTNFLKNKNQDPEISGKTLLLFDKLDSIIENGEKVLIFTQFREMGDLLQYFIHQRYDDEPMFYHGGSSTKQRNEMVKRFQEDRHSQIFILSLKAAGTGLNLTAANHVIHYDLWWNPAVEAQATDRAYRIGQKKNVMVHRFITRNTFEEKINEMIQEKKYLADLTVSTGENWIGELSNKELRAIFELK